MATQPANPSHRQADLRAADSVLAATALVAVAAVTWLSGSQRLLGYVWLDVAAVHFVAALPLAIAACMWVTRQDVSAGVVGLGAVGLTVVGWFAGLQPMEQAMLRLVVALSVAVGVVWLLSARLRRQRWQATGQSSAEIKTLAAVGCGMLAVVPWIYIQARCRHDVDQLAQMLEQSRIGEAHALSRRILELSPTAQWNGRGLSEINRELAAVVEQLQRSVAQPLPPDVSDERWLARVREQAILGQHAAALDLIAADPVRAGLPETCNLRGTMLETLHRWQPAGEAYAAAKRAWESRPASPQQRAGLVQAVTGVAYAQRKQGHYRAAEAAYQQRLALAPTADSHFLLAQFYEDTQRSALARTHARQAMTLAPEQYQQSGEQLLKKLATFHFGCFQN